MAAIKKLNKVELGKILIPAKIYTLKFKHDLERLYTKLYFDNLNYLIVFNSFVISILVALLGYILGYQFVYNTFTGFIEAGGISKFIVIFITWTLFHLACYYLVLLLYYVYKDSIFKKKEFEIQKDLPEFIDNLVSNLKGGISLEKALIKSVRKEQTTLLEEITLINEKIMMGQGTANVLNEFRNRFDSAVIIRTFFLIEEGIKGGGNLAKPLSRISDNLKRIYALDDEIKGNAGGFAVVIQAITIFVAPLLFALALTLLTFIGNLFGLLSESGNNFITAGEVPEEFTEYLQTFSYAMIILITFFSSLITSQLKNEKAFKAVKYLPFYIVLSLTIYSIASKFLLDFFGGII